MSIIKNTSLLSYCAHAFNLCIQLESGVLFAKWIVPEHVHVNALLLNFCRKASTNASLTEALVAAGAKCCPERDE